MISISRFKAVIFDFDGVIIDSERLQARAWCGVAAELGLGRTVGVHETAGKLDRHIAPELFPGQDHDWCIRRKKLIEQALESEGGPAYIEPTLALAGRIAGTHRLAICSSSSPGRIREVLGGRGLVSRFEVIVGQEPGDECKPSPAPYLKALRLLGVSAGEACALEDSPTGLTAAKGAGLYAIQLLHDGVGACELADAVVRSAGEISAS
jgi:HAD superfamily hydrolase (TIGR01509 family)